MGAIWYPVLILKISLLFIMCVWYAYVCGHVSAEVNEGQKRVSGALDLESQVVVSCLMWVLGTEPRSSSARAASALNL